jgi:hypothetical protein
MSDEQIEVVVEVPSDVTEVVVEVPSDVTEVVVYEGMVGPKGDPGPQGPQGPQGDPTTVNGKTGASITLDAGDVGAIPATDKGAANGVATLDSTGKVTSTQLPPLDYIPTSQKGAANGVATLDGTGVVPASELPPLDYIPNAQKGVANGVATLDGTGKVTGSQLPSLDYIPTSQKGAANGVATLDSTGKVPVGEIPALNYDPAGAAAAAQAAAISTSEAFATAADAVVASNAAADATSKANAAQAAAISTAEGYADANFIPLTQRGAAAGVATLDGTGKVPTSQLPPLAITDTFVVNSQAAMLALDAQVGDVAVRTDVSKSFILKAAPASTLANWQELLSPPNAVSSVDGRTGAVSLSDLDDASGAAATVQGNLNTHTGATTSVHGISNTANLVATTDTGTVTSTMILDGTIVNGDINAAAAIAATKISGTAVTRADSGTVTSAMIANNTIVDADINSAAAIAKTKIAGTAITAADTGTVTSTMILDGTIVNADINATAAIDKTKISGTAVTLTDVGTVSNTMLAPIDPTKVTGTAVTQADTGTVTNTMLAGSIAPSKITGTAVTQADTGTVTSTMIANGTIIDADISSSAAIATSKLAANTIGINGVSVPLGGSTSVLPSNGTAGMVLAKRTNADYDTQWVSTTITGSQGYYGSFYDTTSQHAASTTVAYPITLNTFDSGNGISIPTPGGGSQITFVYTAVYNLQMSVQLANGSNSAVDVSLWLRINGVDSDASTGTITVPGRHGNTNGQIVSSWDYTIILNAGDYVQFMWHTDSTQAFLEALPAGTNPTTPVSPSFAVTAQQVTNLALPQGNLTVTAPITSTGSAGNYNIGIDQTALTLSKTQITGTAVTLADTGTVSNTMLAGSIAASKISGTAVTQADTGTVTSTMIANGTIVDANINSAAAIAATKISGTAVTQADTGTVTSTMIANGTIVDADINSAAAIAPSKIGQASATYGQKLVWNGTAWVPALADIDIVRTFPQGFVAVSTATVQTNRTYYMRVFTPGTISKLTFNLGALTTATGTVYGAIYSNTGTGVNAAPNNLVTSGSITFSGTTSAGQKEITLGATTNVNVGDWIAITFALSATIAVSGATSGTTAAFYRQGFAAVQSSTTTPPATAAPNNIDNTIQLAVFGS